RNYADIDSRLALRSANAVEGTWLHIDRGHHARAGNRSEHDDLQRPQRRAAAAIALSESRTTGADLGQAAGARFGRRGRFGPRIRRLPGSESRLLIRRGLHLIEL